MSIKPKFMRDFWSLIFTVYYLVCAEQADEKVRKVRGALTVQHLRVSWNKAWDNTYLRVITGFLRPRFMRYKPRQLRIPRPHESSYDGHVDAWLYFDGSLAQLKQQTKFILDIPGGGFVAMTPRMHDDKLMAWAGKTGLPILSLNYKKAPEYPYPYALNECFDVYHMLIATRGRCIGLSGEVMPKIVVSGDSAGGNLAVGMTLMILQAGSTDQRRYKGETALPLPEGLVLMYPALDVNIGNWMTDEQMALIKERRMRKTNKAILKQKSADYHNLTQPNTPHHSDDEADDEDHNGGISPPKRQTPMSEEISASTPKSAVSQSASSQHPMNASNPQTPGNKPATAYRTRLAMSSMISYFNDRVLTPEMMRAMIILYIGPHSRPDFSTEYLLSPVLTPESLLARFPKTYIMTGERDPLVDDTVIFAGRLRQAHYNDWFDRKELGLEKTKREFVEEDVVEVVLVPGISHGFLNFVGIFPPGWKYVERCAKWMLDLFDESEQKELERQRRAYFGTPSIVTDATAKETGRLPTNGKLTNGTAVDDTTPEPRQRHHRRVRTGSSADEDRPLEMLRMSNPGKPSPPHKTNGDYITNGGAAKNDPSKVSDTASAAKSKDKDIKNKRHSLADRRRKSLISLASEEDLLGRRMKGLTSGLVAMDPLVPPTP